MADENETPEQTTEQQDPKDALPKSWEDIFKHPRFKELSTRAAKAEKALADADAAKLKEINDYKSLFEKTESELKTERANNLRLKVASSKGIPADLFDRLRGETEEELAKDADTLLALLKPAPKADDKGKGLPSLNGGGGSPEIDFTKETDPAKIREAYRKKQ
jgi:hypothetical protein